jgi:hypothetical protein
MVPDLLLSQHREDPMSKSLRLLAATAVLLSMMEVSDAHAAAKKNCRVLCKTELAACVSQAKAQNDCTGLKGKAKRDCHRAERVQVRSCKQGVMSGCRASTNTATCS